MTYATRDKKDLIMTCCWSWISHLSNYIHDFLPCSWIKPQQKRALLYLLESRQSD